MNNKLEKHFESDSKTRKLMIANLFKKKISKQDAEDIIQDTYIKCIRSIERGSYKEVGTMDGWILTAANNTAIDYFRRKERNPVKETFGLLIPNSVTKFIDKDFTDLSAYEQFESNFQKIESAILKLSPIQRQVTEMVLQGIKIREIANQLNSSVSTILGVARYGRINIQKLININNKNR